MWLRWDGKRGCGSVSREGDKSKGGHVPRERSDRDRGWDRNAVLNAIANRICVSSLLTYLTIQPTLPPYLPAPSLCPPSRACSLARFR